MTLPGPVYTPESGIQRNPSAYVHSGGAKVFVVWEDNRFVNLENPALGNVYSGWATFGTQLNVSGTAMTKDADWSGDTSGEYDTGVAVVLHDFNNYGQSPVLFPYNNNAGFIMYWVDFEVNANGSDLVYTNPLAAWPAAWPAYLPAW